MYWIIHDSKQSSGKRIQLIRSVLNIRINLVLSISRRSGSWDRPRSRTRDLVIRCVGVFQSHLPNRSYSLTPICPRSNITQKYKVTRRKNKRTLTLSYFPNKSSVKHYVRRNHFLVSWPLLTLPSQRNWENIRSWLHVVETQVGR